MANKPTQPVFPLGLAAEEQSTLAGLLNTGTIEHGPDAVLTLPEGNASAGLPSSVRYNADSDEFEGFYENGGWLPLGGGGIRWEVLPHASTATLTEGRGYLINNTTGASTVVLPSPTRVGDSVTICDAYGKFATYPLTVSPSGNNLYGSTEDMAITTDNVSATFTWSGPEQGWIITSGVGLGQGRVYSREIFTKILASETSSVTLNTPPTIVDVYADGKRLAESKYSLDGNVITFSPSLPASTELQVIEYTPIQLGIGDGSGSSTITWVYNGGSAIGGETEITLDVVVDDVPAIDINGSRQYKNLGFTFDPLTSKITLAQELEPEDEVVVIINGTPNIYNQIDHTLREVARATNVKDTEVVYFSVGAALSGYKVIYDKETQRAYPLPADIAPGTTAVSLSSSAVLVHSAGSVDLGELAVTREEYVTLSGSFDTGVTVNTKNELVVFTDGKYRWDGALPKDVPADSTPATTGGTGSGLWISVGAHSIREWVNKNITINFKTVSELVAGTLPSGENISLVEGMLAETAANEYGIKTRSKWRVSATKDSSTYAITLANGLFANLILHRNMGYEEFGFGGTDPVANSAAIDEANRVARANAVIKKLIFPAGTFSTNQVTLDVDRRGFTFSGAGNDATILMSADSDISLHHVGIDPRDRNRDRLHWHQTVEGFTVNGGVGEKGASAAGRAIYTAPYATVKNKSINHRISNYDLLHLVMHWYGHSQGTANGATSTKYGVRVRNNSIKLMGYIGGSTGQCTVSIEGMSTTLSSIANIGDTTVTVADAAGFDTWFEIAFTNSTGGVETRRITAISGNVLTLDRAMTSSFPSGTKVEVPIVGTSVISSTIETGEIRIGDSQATYLAGNYSEEAKIYLTKYVRALTITGMSTAEASPAISINVDKRSSIKIEGNDTTFSIAVNITDRSGSVGERIDLYSAPKLDISMNTRVQNPIILNGVYGLSSLKIDKTFDTVVQDNRFTRMTFSGFNYVAPAGGSSAEVMKFFQDATQFGFDGYTFDLDIVCRRDGDSSAVTPGILKRYGTSSAAPVAQNSAPVSLFADFNASTGYDVFIGASGNRGTVQIRPNPTLAIKAAISGTVTSVI